MQITIDGALAADGSTGRWEVFQREPDGAWYSEDRTGTWSDSSIGGAVANSIGECLGSNRVRRASS